MQYQFGPGPLKSEYDPMIQKLKSDIGIVEDTDIAQHVIAQGQYVVWKGDLYTAKSDISSGTTLSSSNLQSKTRGIGEDVSALNSKISSTLVETAVNLDTLVVDNYYDKKRWTGNSCANLTNAPAGINSVVPWELEVSCVGSNINYQVQELRVYVSTNQSGSQIFRRQKYYYGVNDYRWNDWVEQPSISHKAMFPVESTTKTFSLVAGHLYLIVGGQPYADPYLAIAAVWTVGAKRLSEIVTNSKVSASFGSSNTVLTIVSTGNLWLRIIDLTYFPTS